MVGLKMADDLDTKERKKRNVALAFVLFGLVVLFYFMTMIRVHW